MYEYGWASGGLGPGSSSGYYVGILQSNSTKGLGYFLTTQYINNPNLSKDIMIIIIQDLDGVLHIVLHALWVVLISIIIS
jgi:hypothetical protein